jgi:hypothetical protein
MPGSFKFLIERIFSDKIGLGGGGGMSRQKFCIWRNYLAGKNLVWEKISSAQVSLENNVTKM